MVIVAAPPDDGDETFPTLIVAPVEPNDPPEIVNVPGTLTVVPPV